MDNKRYDYSPIIRWRKIEWPNHGRIALWVAPNIEYFHGRNDASRLPEAHYV